MGLLLNMNEALLIYDPKVLKHFYRDYFDYLIKSVAIGKLVYEKCSLIRNAYRKISIFEKKTITHICCYLVFKTFLFFQIL